MEHGKSVGSNVHSIVSFTYADSAERLAAVTADFTVEDIDKVAKQLDDGSKWTLDAISPAVVWSALGGGAGAGVALTAIRYVDKGVTSSGNGSQSAPLKTLAEGVAASLVDGATIYVVPGDYSSEGMVTPAHNLQIIGMDSRVRGTSTGGDIANSGTTIGQVNVGAVTTVECSNVHLTNVAAAASSSSFGALNCFIEGNITGLGDCYLYADSSVISCTSINASYIDLANCDVGDGIATAIHLTTGSDVFFWHCTFLPHVTITFAGTITGIVQVDRVTYVSMVSNAVALVNCTILVVDPPLLVKKNGTIVGSNVGAIDIVADVFTSVAYTPPGLGESFGTIAIDIHSSGVWSMAGNLGSDEVYPSEIYPGPGIRFIPDLAPALGIGLIDLNGVKAVRMVLTLLGTQSSTKHVPVGAVIHGCLVNITTPFTAGTTMKVGRAGSLALLQDVTDSDPTVVNIYDAPQDTAWGGGDESIVVTLLNGGAIAAGAGFVTILYSIPNA